MKKRRTHYLSATALLIVLLTIVCSFCFYHIHDLQKDKKQLSYQTEAFYQRNLGELANSLQTINAQLAQLLVTTSQEQLLYGLSCLWREVHSAVTSLSSLPIAMHELEKTGLLLHDIAEYSYFLMKSNVLTHKPLSENDWTKLETFYQRSSLVQNEVDYLESKILSENQLLASLSQQNEENFLFSAFRNIENQIAEFPEILFADGVEKITPEPVPIIGEQISESEAITHANKFIHTLPTSQNQQTIQGKLLFVANSANIPVYGIAYSDNRYVIVSQAGGHILQYYHSKKAQPATYSAKDLEANANKLLHQLGFTDMVCVERKFDTICASYVYVPQQDHVYLYPDMIKLQMSLSDGALLHFDQTNYQTQHSLRVFPAPLLSENDVSTHRNPNFLKEEIHLALITDAYSNKEILTYEIRGTILGETFSIFVDAQTGKEIQIIRL